MDKINWQPKEWRGRWVAYARVDKKPVRRSLGLEAGDETAAEALRRLDILAGQNNRVARGAAPTIGEILDAHLADKPEHVRQAVRFKRAALAAGFDHVMPANLTREKCQAHIDARAAAGRQPSTSATRCRFYAARCDGRPRKPFTSRAVP